ncbi:hypothetical protein N7454_007005 [Penicillium verhagenii]|nr:hypothetical protein N7454_007005 [Penicillium verhagenii]
MEQGEKIEAYITAVNSSETTIPEKQDDLSAKSKVLPEVKVAELNTPAEVSSPKSDAPYRAGTCIIVTDLTHPVPIQSFVPVAEKATILSTKQCISRILVRFMSTMQSAQTYVKRNTSVNHRSDLEEVEYKALMFLSAFITFYILACLSFGILTVGIWIQIYSPEVSLTDGISPFWTGAFLATSSFSNNGMSLIDTNMIPFQRQAAPLLICGTLILAGNTMFPCLLRLSIWTMRKMLPDRPTWQTWRQTLDYALVQSQSLCSSLFPTWHTWFLFGTVLVLNAIMWGGFELAAIRDMEIRALPAKFRALDGLFQSMSIRGGGFSIVEFDALPQGLLMLYGFMMYLSAFPVSAAIGSAATPETPKDTTDPIYPSAAPISTPPPSILGRSRFLYQQLRCQFSHDIWWLSFAILLITIAESDHYKLQPVEFSTFNVIFEVISAYSCVGASIGYPGSNFAFCGQWHTFSKLLLVAISLKGRLRGLSIATNTTSTTSTYNCAKTVSVSLPSYGSYELGQDRDRAGRAFDTVELREKEAYIESNRRISSCV